VFPNSLEHLILLLCFIAKGMIKRLVFIINYDINFLLSSLKWLFLVHESEFLCFKCSCYTHILFHCEKNSPMRKAQVASLEQVYE